MERGRPQRNGNHRCEDMVAKRRSPATPTACSGTQTNHLNMLVKMEPSILDKGARIVGMHALLCKNETLQVDLSQMEPYFEIMAPTSYS